MLPFDLTALLRRKLAENRREPDGKLHPSSHLTGSMRHVMLDLAGAPQIEREIAADVNLAVGTAIHSLFESTLRGKPVMLEVKLDQWMPEGWSGTADWIVWDPERRLFILGDLKTAKPGGVQRVISHGAKESHIWQVSSYWWALARMGLPLLDGACVYYLPKNQGTERDGGKVEPTLQELNPLPQQMVEGEMFLRRAQVNEYLASIKPVNYTASIVDGVCLNYGHLLTDKLTPVQERDVALVLNKKLKVPAIDVKLRPNWSTAYCDFPDELCDCRHQKENKVGQWNRQPDGTLEYTPSKGYEDYFDDDPTHPSAAQTSALVKAIKEASDGSA
jgi:hypothetical protein